jgi:hypothetical protein
MRGRSKVAEKVRGMKEWGKRLGGRPKVVCKHVGTYVSRYSVCVGRAEKVTVALVGSRMFDSSSV